ncbi:DUF3997 domain-containing protein [Romboutsia lituseburensis]|uniref:DUF3997 domain-containing protein n=1 Tax=Romboutsia lituseburensis TaxID=1537 RepID=UPI00215A679A|nr:DUF3997 domain-containing protein [Romboutsia lituseburensis]MCR8747159.1 DUF3997 domain-containing protein [Romboutsia lituseburensis]
MKKFKIILITVFSAIAIVGCEGAGDYEIELINGFTVNRSSSEKICISSHEYSYEKVLIPTYDNYEDGEYVIEVGHDKDRYIVAKTNLNQYYIMNTMEIKVYGPLTEELFNNKKENLDISKDAILKTLDDMKITD